MAARVVLGFVVVSLSTIFEFVPCQGQIEKLPCGLVIDFNQLIASLYFYSIEVSGLFYADHALIAFRHSIIQILLETGLLMFFRITLGNQSWNGFLRATELTCEIVSF